MHLCSAKNLSKCQLFSSEQFSAQFFILTFLGVFNQCEFNVSTLQHLHFFFCLFALSVNSFCMPFYRTFIKLIIYLEHKNKVRGNTLNHVFMMKKIKCNRIHLNFMKNANQLCIKWIFWWMLNVFKWFFESIYISFGIETRILDKTLIL